MSDGPHIVGPTYRELEAERDALKARCERLVGLLRKADDCALIEPICGTRCLELEDAIHYELDAIDRENTKP